MFVFFIIIYFLLIFAKQQSVYGDTHALTGNFSELNPKDCGITRLVRNLDFSCFKWYNNPMEKMKGRNATENEVPFISYFTNRTSGNSCSGVIIADQWMLTAAHCLKSNNSKELNILLGQHETFTDLSYTYRVNASEVHIHPGFGIIFNFFNDLALIKFDRPINLIKPEKGDRPNDLKSICLPEPNVFNKKQELVMIAGWGQVRADLPVQVGVRKIFPPDDYSFRYSSNFFVTLKINQFLLCEGDSGGPLWQFNKGRAVLVGITSFVYTGLVNNETQCENLTIGTVMISMRVSKYIDWIKNVTKLS